MTKFCDVEILYQQFFNLEDEITTLIEEENYDEVSLKVEHKSALMKKLLNAQKTLKLNSQERTKLQELGQKLREKDRYNLKILTNLRDGVEEELKQTKKKVKVNTAYSVKKEHENGVFFDTSE